MLACARECWAPLHASPAARRANGVGVNQGDNKEMVVAQIVVTAIGVLVAASAVFVAVLALSNWLNTLENQRADECLAAVYAVVALANRCLSLKEKIIASERIWQFYTEAWNGHSRFASAWEILRRYHPQLDAGMPDRICSLLMETEAIVARPGPITESEKKICQQITGKLLQLRGEVQSLLPSPSRGFLRTWLALKSFFEG